MAAVIELTAENEIEFRGALRSIHTELNEKYDGKVSIQPAEFLAATAHGSKYIVHFETVGDGYTEASYATIELLHE